MADCDTIPTRATARAATLTSFEHIGPGPDSSHTCAPIANGGVWLRERREPPSCDRSGASNRAGGPCERVVAGTDEPTERIDTKILEVVMQLDDGTGLGLGLRVMRYVQPSGA